MTEWRLFEEGTVPAFATSEFFAGHPWIDPVHQLGHDERTTMVADLVADAVRRHDIKTIVDLGCGDGSLLVKIRDRVEVTAWGYELGIENQRRACDVNHVDVRNGNFLTDALEYGELVIATEVVEHLLDPRTFISGLPGSFITLSSPVNETDVRHYEHHTFAWDFPGYDDLVTECGWTVRDHDTCPAGFQAIFAER